MISRIFTPRLSRTIRVLPTAESAARYMKVLESDKLNRSVTGVIFQTRIDPSPTPCWDESTEQYTEPHDFFLEAIDKVGLFRNLKSACLVFSENCSGGDCRCGYNDHHPEQIEFREPLLEKFFSSLNHKDHPATGVVALSIKNLQDKTPAALTGTQENNFKKDFREVMSRIHHLSLQIATEYYESAPEHTLEIPEAHDFFNHELEKYWLEPVSKKLTYLKLYAAEMYWGYYPRCNLPRFPNLDTMILGNMTFTHDEQLEWILSHGEKLQKLTLDDCPIVVGARYCEETVSPDRHVVRGQAPVNVFNRFPGWSYEPRWHNHFNKIRNRLPSLKEFTYGFGPWDQHAAFEKADSLTSSLAKERYTFYHGGTGPSPWLRYSYEEGIFNDGDEEEDFVYRPKCDYEDQQALDELQNELQVRRESFLDA